MRKFLSALYIFLIVATLIIGVFPVSAERDLRIGDVVNINGLEATIIGVQNGVPVYQSIIAPNIYGSSSDGIVYKADGVYNTARTSATGTVSTSATTVLSENAFMYGTQYRIWRTALYFDTTLLSGYTVTAGTINIYVDSIYDTDNEAVQIQSGMPTYPHDPMVAGDYDLTNYAGDGGSKDITTFVVSAYNSITLNAGGLAMINTSGITKFMLRTTGDINNIAPTGQNTVRYYSSEKGSGYQPYLSITYTALTPAIISVAASNVATTSARLNSDITEDGGDPTCQIEFGYGTTSKLAANFAAYDTITAVTIPVSDYDEDDNPYLDVSGLIAGTPYFYRVRITNELGSVVSTDEQTFSTIAVIDDMTSLVGYPNSDNISLNWVRANGATNTLIRVLTDTYPTDETGADGSTLVYNGTETSYIHASLTGGTTYYYSAWGESGGVYSTNEINLAMTTSDELGSDDMPAGSTPSGWYQNPDETFLVNLQPFYSVINGVSDSWGMPRGNMWLIMSFIFIMLVGVILYIKFRAPAFSMGVMALLIMGFVALHILGSFALIIVFFLALGAWATRPGVGN